MASIKLEGLDKYQKELESLDRNITGILKRGVYDGAAVVADAVRAAIGGLTTVSDFSGLKAYKRRTPTTLTEGQKAGLFTVVVKILIPIHDPFAPFRCCFAFVRRS